MNYARLILSVLVLSSIVISPAHAVIIEDFDGNGTTPFTLTNTSGGPPSILNTGPNGDYVRLANLNGSNNNSIAFDEEPTMTGAAPAGLKFLFDFRMSDDAANAAAGGCCGSSADGLGIGLYSTAIYGTTGGANPTTMGQGSDIWERPAHNGAFSIGLDIFQNIDEVNLNWDGAEIANADVSSQVDLNDNTWHRASLEILPNGADATANLWIISDVHGNTDVHSIFSGVAVGGLDLNSLGGYRVIGGGRTGGAFVDGDIDNIAVFAIPEPTSLTLLAISSLGLLAFRRRQK